MAIALDTTTESAKSATATLTWSHTCTGSNLILIVGGFSAGASTTDVITGITYNGVSMTRINTDFVSAQALTRSYLYYLIAPATGAHNIVVSSSDASYTLHFNGVSYTGAKQSGQPDASAISSTSGTPAGPLSNTLTTVADNSLHLATFCPNDHAITASSALVVVQNADSSGIFSSNPALVTPAASNSLSVTWTGTQAVSGVGASFAPFTAPAANTSLGFFNLV